MPDHSPVSPVARDHVGVTAAGQVPAITPLPSEMPEWAVKRADVLAAQVLTSQVIGDGSSPAERLLILARHAAHLEAIKEYLEHCLDHWADRPEVIAANVARGRLEAALRNHHEWQKQSDVFGHDDGKGSYIAIDNSQAYAESVLCEQTMAALALCPDATPAAPSSEGREPIVTIQVFSETVGVDVQVDFRRNPANWHAIRNAMASVKEKIEREFRHEDRCPAKPRSTAPDGEVPFSARDASASDLTRFQNEVWGILDGFMKRMGTGIGGHQPEAWAMVSDAIADRERLMQQFGVPSQAMIDVAAERRRHFEVEGWTAEHDDEHGDGSMARAAASYAYVAGASERERANVSGIFTLSNNFVIREIWPWEARWWKPKDRYTDLKRAAALCIAEMDRLLRKEARNG